MDEEPESIQLEVSMSFPSDEGLCRARLDVNFGFVPGDYVEIIGEKGATTTKFWRHRLEDRGSNRIRIDEITRRNCGVGLSEMVRVRRVKPMNCEKLTIVQSGEVNKLYEFDQGFESFLKSQLAGRPIRCGDKFKVPGLKVNLLFESVETSPSGVLVITRDTKIVVIQPETLPDDIDTVLIQTPYDKYTTILKATQKVRSDDALQDTPVKKVQLMRRFSDKRRHLSSSTTLKQRKQTLLTKCQIDDCQNEVTNPRMCPYCDRWFCLDHGRDSIDSSCTNC